MLKPFWVNVCDGNRPLSDFQLHIVALAQSTTPCLLITCIPQSNKAARLPVITCKQLTALRQVVVSRTVMEARKQNRKQMELHILSQGQRVWSLLFAVEKGSQIVEDRRGEDWNDKHSR